MIAEILNIGDELLIGQTLNTNAQWLGEQLNLAGFRVNRITAIGDEHSEILSALHECGQRAALVLVTGGLGPTRDDITKKALCEFFDTDLVMNNETLERITRFFAQRNLPMPDVNRDQALMPRNCTVIPNMRGTANGMWWEKGGSVFISMPGVPYETEGMMRDEILGRIADHFRPKAIVHRSILTQGVGESFLAETIAGWENSLAVENIKLAYLPHPGGVKLRLSAYDGEQKILEEKIERKKSELIKLIGHHVYGYGNDSLPSVVLSQALAKGITVSGAESCTGGSIAQQLTSVAGSSGYFRGAIVAYTPESKISQLGVDENTARTSVYSTECAGQMAEGARRIFNTDFAFAITGVAGPQPDPAYPGINIGQVFIAIAGKGETKSKVLQLGKHRGRNIQVAAQSVMFMLYKEILNCGA